MRRLSGQVPAAKADALSLILEATKWKERTNSHESSSGFYTQTQWHTCNTHRLNKCNLKTKTSSL